MPGKKRPAADDGDSSEDEINVDQVIKTKAELDKVSLPVSFLTYKSLTFSPTIRSARTVRRSESR